MSARSPRGDRRWPTALTASLLAALVLAVTLPMLATGHAISTDHDWLTHLLHHRFIRDALLQGQLPSWNPWVAGGYPIAGHPEFPFPSPLLLGDLALGEALGLKLGASLFFAAGVVGTWLLARRSLGLGPAGALVAAALLASSSWFVWCVADGNYVELHYLLFPGIVLGLSGRGWRGLVLAAALWALVVFDGNVALLAMGLGAAVVLPLLPVGDGGWRPRLARLIRLALSLGLAALMAAGKALPMAALLARDARGLDSYAVAADAFYTPASLLGSLLALEPVGAQPYPLSRIAIAMVALPLVVLGVPWARRRIWPWLVLGLVGTLLAMGPAAPVDLFGLLWRLPLFHSMQHPAKCYDFFIVLPLALAGGAGAQASLAWVRRRWSTAPASLSLVVVGLVLLACLPRVVELASTARATFDTPPLQVERAASFHQLRGDDLPRYGERPLQAEAYPNLLAGTGLLDWKQSMLWSDVAQPRYLVDAQGQRREARDYRGEAWLAEGRGSVGPLRVDARGLRFDVQLDSAAGLVVINQNHDPSFVAAGGRLEDRGGLLALQLDGAGEHQLRLVAHPPGQRLGLILGLLAAIGCALLARWDPRWRRLDALLYGAGVPRTP